MASHGITTTITVLGLLMSAACKVYDRCELARELRDVHELPVNQIATWVCLARHESEFNTSALNPGSGDHGIFQISELFWCSPPGYACGISCEDLHDNDLEDDVICARRIYREHQRLSGDGFNAWVVYQQFCRDKYHVQKMIEGCFGANDKKYTTTPPAESVYYPPFTQTTPLKSSESGPTVTSNEIISTHKVLSTFSIPEAISKATTPVPPKTTAKSAFGDKTSAKLVLKTFSGFAGSLGKTTALFPTKYISGKKEGTSGSTRNYAYTINKTGFRLERTSL